MFTCIKQHIPHPARRQRVLPGYPTFTRYYGRCFCWKKPAVFCVNSQLLLLLRTVPWNISRPTRDLMGTESIEPWLSACPSLLLSGFWHCSSPFSSVAVEGNRAAFVLKVSRNVVCSSVFQDGLSLPCCIKLLELTIWWERTVRASPAAQETVLWQYTQKLKAFQTSNAQDWCLWASCVTLTWMDQDTGLLGRRAGGKSLQLQAQPALT